VTALGFLGLLLVASYLGGFVIGGQRLRARGLASGAGWVLLGFVAGPSVLGLVGRDSLDLFVPLAEVGVGWLAVDSGLAFGRVLGRRVRPVNATWGILVAVLTAASVSLAVATALRWIPRLSAAGPVGRDRWILILGLGAALAETTRSVLRWASQRFNAKGPLFDGLADLSSGDDLVPVLLAAVAVALEPVPSAFGPLPVAAGAAAQLLTGWVMGAAAAMMIGRKFRLNVFRGVILGMTLVAIGFSVRLGLSLLALPFGLGLGLASVSRHRARVRRAAVSERFVLLPILFLAGAMTPVVGIVPGLAAVAVAARLLTKTLAGVGLWGAWREARPAGAWLGVGLVSSGALSICVGMSFALRFPGVVGSTILAASTLGVVVGELIGPASLRRALQNAGELPEPVAEPVAETPVEVPT
jgi:hypothetical protein